MNKKIMFLFMLAFSLVFSCNILASSSDVDFKTDSGVVYEYYVDTNGYAIKSRTSTNASSSSSYSKNAPDIDDYVCVNARVNNDNLLYSTSYDYDDGINASISNVDKDGDFVVFIYKGKNAGYTKVQDVEVNYINFTTGHILDTVIYEDERVGSNFSITPATKKTYNGKSYHFVKSSPSADNDKIVNYFVSEKNGYNEINLYYNYGSVDTSYITVHFIDIDTDKEFDTDYIYDLKVNDEYVYSVKSKGGYNFISSSPSANSSQNIKIKVDDDNDDNEIYCYYRKIYKDSNSSGNTQYYVSPTDTFYNNGTNNPNPNIVVPTATNKITSSGILMNKDLYYSFVSGYPNNTFKPNNNITRAEASQMFYSIILDTNLGNEKTNYSDLNYSAWYYKPVQYFASRGIINGYFDNTIRPNNNITRAEFIKMAMEINGFSASNSTNLFNDVSIYDWYYYYVRAGVDANLISGYDAYSFKPNNYITRSEAIKIIDLMIGRTEDKQNLYNDVYYTDVNNSMWQYNYIKMANGIQKY